MAKKGEQSGVRPIVIERDLLHSRAFLSLTGMAPQVLMLFLARRRMEQDGSRRRRWRVANNGEIEFTYKEAEGRWGMSRSTFKRAVEQLVDRGFIDISQQGLGICGSKNLYAISERWRKWGTDSYVEPKPLPKVNKHGFQKGHSHAYRAPALTVLTGTHGAL